MSDDDPNDPFHLQPLVDAVKAAAAVPPKNASRKTFNLSFDIDEIFTVDELWPDGDAPADPTEADVKALIAKCGGWRRILDDWGLIDYFDQGEVREVHPYVPRVKRTHDFDTASMGTLERDAADEEPKP